MVAEIKSEKQSIKMLTSWKLRKLGNEWDI